MAVLLDLETNTAEQNLVAEQPGQQVALGEAPDRVIVPGLPIDRQVIHDSVGPAGLRPAVFDVVGPVEQVDRGVLSLPAP